jgi:hypothetical protein
MRALRRMSDARSNCPGRELQLLRRGRHVTHKQSDRNRMKSRTYLLLYSLVTSLCRLRAPPLFGTLSVDIV